MKVRPLHDGVIVDMDDLPGLYSSGLIRVGTPPSVRTGTVRRVGPGVWKWNSRTDERWFQKTELVPGDRVVFPTAAAETSQGKQICHKLGDNQVLLKETEVLLVVDDPELRVE